MTTRAPDQFAKGLTAQLCGQSRLFPGLPGCFSSGTCYRFGLNLCRNSSRSGGEVEVVDLVEAALLPRESTTGISLYVAPLRHRLPRAHDAARREGQRRQHRTEEQGYPWLADSVPIRRYLGGRGPKNRATQG